ncbi:MAG: hypothetical protein M3162_08720 [Thermoproteota archaeon]|nr:hypothetical protein [Thermoproteota archaeon]
MISNKSISIALVLASISLSFTIGTINYAFSQADQGSTSQASSNNQSTNQASPSSASGAEQTSRVNGSEVFTSNQNATLVNNTSS